MNSDFVPEKLSDISNISEESISSHRSYSQVSQQSIQNSCLSTSSSAVSREIEHLRNEIRILASEAKRKHSNLSIENSRLEDNVHHERRKKKNTEEKLKEIARTAEKIKSASQVKIKTIENRATKLESELRLSKEQNFNLETQILLLKDDQRNLQNLRNQFRNISEELSVTKGELEFARNQRDLTPPQPDYDDKLQNKNIEFKAQLREKEIEIEHLDQRLRERSEKLNENVTKLNLNTKENIKLKKKIEKLTEENVNNQNLILDKKLDLEKERIVIDYY
jgi:hypothetical protein